MSNDPGHSPKPQVRVLEKTVEWDILEENWEDLVAASSGPQYVWRKRARGKVREENKFEAG